MTKSALLVNQVTGKGPSHLTTARRSKNLCIPEKQRQTEGKCDGSARARAETEKRRDESARESEHERGEETEGERENESVVASV